jgi:hypothetical protein
MVMPKSGKKFDMDAVTINQLHEEFKVPKGLFTMAAGLIPNLFDIGKFSVDVPMFDLKKKILKIVMGIKDGGGEKKYMIKLNVSFGDAPHEVSVTTDGGKNWQKLSYSGPKKDEYATDDVDPKEYDGELDTSKVEPAPANKYFRI